MSAWLFQDPKQVAKVGKQKCKWSVGWRDPNGKRKQKTIGAKSHAERFKRKIEAELQTGTYRTEINKSWAEFRSEYESKILLNNATKTRDVTKTALNNFERIVNPQKIRSVNTAMIDSFVSLRRLERGKKPGSKVSPATINRELRTLKAVMNIAVDWKYLPEAPRFRMVREHEEIGQVMTPEHFQKIYDACNVASKPSDLGT